MLRIETNKNPEQKAGEELSKKLKAYSGQQVLLLLSGGSAFDVLTHVSTSVITDNMTICMADERFSTDPRVNNFIQLEQTTFMDTCIEKGCTIIGTRIHKTETLPKAVLNFDASLRRWRKEYPDGAVIALLGVGEDSHTAGVLPFPENKRLFQDLFLDEEWVASFDATCRGGQVVQNEHALRFTTTLTFLKEEVKHAVVFAVGANKKLALERIADASLSIHQVPAKVFREMEDVIVVTDQDIAL